jgi:DNA (cytosine-5)-methyltransferase 1
MGGAAEVIDDGAGKPWLLDGFSGAGGAARGYRRAGWFVVGVDIKPQPRYAGDVFVQGDALEFARLCGRYFDAVHLSPPCQRFSDLAHRNGNALDHPDLIAPSREVAEALGIPYVIENVESAPIRADLLLCGTMFEELRVLRHRKFELGGGLVIEPPPPCDNVHPLVFTHDKRKRHYGKLDQNTSFVQVTGGGNCTLANARKAMGIDWMTKDEINEAIPPAYSEFIGAAMLDHVRAA